MVAKIKDIWMELSSVTPPAIRLRWDNERNQRIEMGDTGADDVIQALEKLIILLRSERDRNKI